MLYKRTIIPANKLGSIVILHRHYLNQQTKKPKTFPKSFNRQSYSQVAKREIFRKKHTLTKSMFSANIESLGRYYTCWHWTLTIMVIFCYTIFGPQSSRCFQQCWSCSEPCKPFAQLSGFDHGEFISLTEHFYSLYDFY